MKSLIKALATKDRVLAEEVEQLVAELPNYKLTMFPDEPFGMKPWPKGLYAMKVNDDKVDNMVEEHLEDEEAFEERYGLPEGWNIQQVLEILAILGEFAPLTPKKTGNTPRNLARALMQMIEAYSEPDAYMGKESGFPQNLRNFESVANWLLKKHLVSLNSTRAIKRSAPEGMFHEASVKRLLKDYGLSYNRKK